MATNAAPHLAAAFRDQPVLITGGLGFIGSNLARRLADLGARVTAIDSLIPEYGGKRFNLAGYEERVRINIADVRDEYSMDHLVRGQAFIFNLAGQVSHLDSMHNPYTDLDINCRSQLSILEACRKHNPSVRLVYSGTRQIYGRPRYLPVDEQHPVDPVDVNGVNKVAGEWYHIVYQRAYGLRATSLRLTNTYGPRMRVVDARQTFLGIWLRRLLQGDEILVFGDGRQRRDFTYVDDAVEALLRAATCEAAVGAIYNLGGEEVISLQALAELLIELQGSGRYRLVPFPAEQKAIDIGDYFGSYARAKADLGWQPRVGLREGLTHTLAYYAAHGHEYWP
ncbi:MAG: NAD-dependent epimerase/dehydratase family protein [Anaerolineales bacterium]|nr:NAD-dependent epimerase/dehydratase family protein [Anaerolineales bacterium]